jgi:O-antigen ligase
MAASRKNRRGQAAPAHGPTGEASEAGARLAALVLYAIVIVPPFILMPTAKDSFRLPKLLVSEWLGLLSLLPLAWEMAREGAWRRLRSPFIAILPLVAVGLVSLLTTAHPEHTRRALPSLLIGAACLVGWTAGMSRAALERALRLLLIPAVALAILGVLQFHGLFRPFEFASPANNARLGVVSLAGNPGDLAAYLVMPCLLAQWFAWHGQGRRRVLHGAVAAVCLYGILVSQTLTALAALVLASAVLWVFLLPRRQALMAMGAVAIAAVLVLVAVAPLRVRLQAKLSPLLEGNWNEVLTYRLDAWAAARWMLEREPLRGVGFGGYRAEYIPAKEALLERGRAFNSFALENTFGNAHNDLLEVGAELGWPGLAALAWALSFLARAARRSPREDLPGVAAGLAGMGIVALANFPFEIALVAYSWMVFLAWVMQNGAPAKAGA